MRCPECGADVSPLRDNCPRCGARTDSLFRGRQPYDDGGRSPEELKRNRKTVLIVGAAIAGLIVVSGRLSWLATPFHMDAPFHINMQEPRRGPVVTNADELARAFAADPAAAEKRFGRREIMVSGEFLRIVPDGYGSIDMRLKTSNPDAPLGVDVTNDSVDDAKRLTPGQEVTVSCRRVAGAGNDRWLQDCAIQSGADDGAAPSPSVAPPPAAPPSPK